MIKIDLVAILTSVGYVGITAVVFAESGLLIGIFLPGDSLLFTAGLLASQGVFNIWFLVFLAFVAAALGDSAGYAFGHKVGPRIFTKEDSWLWNKRHIQRTQLFYQKYGAKVLVLARFLPVVRTIAPILAGVGTMKYATFLYYNLIGAAIWAIGITLLGYYLGQVIPNIDTYLLPIILGIVAISVLPSVWELWRAHRESKLPHS
jgi:membrane-associated protein